MRTEENLAALEAALASNCGDFFGACKECLLSPQFVRKWMADDGDVKERLTSATEVGAMQIESAAIERAVRGWTEPVYFKGEKCGEVRKYSDPLHALLLKKRLPGTYGDEAGQAKVVNYGTINIMPRAESYEQWLTMQRETEQALLEDKRAAALEADTIEVEDAEYSLVGDDPYGLL